MTVGAEAEVLIFTTVTLSGAVRLDDADSLLLLLE
jgi:hypothetical protein